MSGLAKYTVASFPSVGESLSGYLERCKNYQAQLEEWSSAHITWYTHRGAGACWICDLLLQLRLEHDVMTDLVQELRRVKFKAVAEQDKKQRIPNPEFFSFKLYKLH